MRPPCHTSANDFWRNELRITAIHSNCHKRENDRTFKCQRLSEIYLRSEPKGAKLDSGNPRTRWLGIIASVWMISALVSARCRPETCRKLPHLKRKMRRDKMSDNFVPTPIT